MTRQRCADAGFPWLSGREGWGFPGGAVPAPVGLRPPRREPFVPPDAAKGVAYILSDAQQAVAEGDIYAGFYHLRTMLEHHLKARLSIPHRAAGPRGRTRRKALRDASKGSGRRVAVSIARLGTFERVSAHSNRRSRGIPTAARPHLQTFPSFRSAFAGFASASVRLGPSLYPSKAAS